MEWEERAPAWRHGHGASPGQWDERLRGLHGVVTVLAQERAVRDARRAELEAEAGDAGMEIPPFAQETDVPADEREPSARGRHLPARDPRSEGRPMASRG